MDAVVMQSFQIVGAFAILVLAMAFALNFITRGFLWTFVKVRASRGRKILGIMHGINDRNYVVATFKEGSLCYKNRDKKNCQIVGVTPICVYPTLGVQGIDIDEVNNCIWNRAGAIIQGNDPQVVDSLINRALMSPEQKSLLIKILIACLLVFIAYLIMQGTFDYYFWKELASFKTATGVV